jgi:hypothetical protein
MPLASNGPIVLHGAPLTAPPPTGPHKPNLAIQARLTPELIAAIVEARKKGLQLQFDPYGPNAVCTTYIYVYIRSLLHRAFT